jgi:hypothetical protein
MKSSLRCVGFAFVYKVGHNAHETGFSGTFAKVRKETISFVVFICLSTWNNSASSSSSSSSLWGRRQGFAALMHYGLQTYCAPLDLVPPVISRGAPRPTT